MGKNRKSTSNGGIGEGRKFPRLFRTPRHGRGKLQIGNPGPRDTTLKEFRRACAEALKDPTFWTRLLEDLRRPGPKGAPARAALLKLWAAYAHGLPRQSIELTGRDSGPVELAAIRQELARKIALPTLGPARE